MLNDDYLIVKQYKQMKEPGEAKHETKIELQKIH